MFNEFETLNESLGNLKNISSGGFAGLLKYILKNRNNWQVSNYVSPNSKIIEIEGVGFTSFMADVKRAKDEHKNAFRLIAVSVWNEGEVIVNRGDISKTANANTQITVVKTTNFFAENRSIITTDGVEPGKGNRTRAKRLGDYTFSEDLPYKAVIIFDDPGVRELRNQRDIAKYREDPYATTFGGNTPFMNRAELRARDMRKAKRGVPMDSFNVKALEDILARKPLVVEGIEYIMNGREHFRYSSGYFIICTLMAVDARENYWLVYNLKERKFDIVETQSV